MGARMSEYPCNVRIGNDLSEFELCNEAPDVGLKCGSFEVQRKIEAAQAFAKISLHLARRLTQELVPRARCARCARSRELASHDGFFAGFDDQHGAQRSRQNRAFFSVQRGLIGRRPGTVLPMPA